jgi:hypothetical protein
MRSKPEESRVAGGGRVGARGPDAGGAKGGRDGKAAKVRLRTMPLSKLIPADYNPRVITEDSLGNLGGSLDEFGYVDPIVWNERTGNVVGGHQRLKVLASRGFKTADVSVVDLDEAAERALNLTLNNRWLQGAWDQAKLRVQLDDLLSKYEEAGRKPFGLRDLSMEIGRLSDLAKASVQVLVPSGPIPAPPTRQVVCPKCGERFEA